MDPVVRRKYAAVDIAKSLDLNGHLLVLFNLFVRAGTDPATELGQLDQQGATRNTMKIAQLHLMADGKTLMP